MKIYFFVSLVFAYFPFCIFAIEHNPPNPYVMELDPSGHVKYGAWTYMKEYEGKKLPPRDILASPGGKKVGSLQSGESFTAIKGEQHVVPRTLEVLFAYTENGVTLKPGDPVFLLGYTGEGGFLVWKDGKTVDIDGLQITDKTDALKDFVKSCTLNCKFVLSTPGYFITNWIKVRTKKNTTGWVEGNKFFDQGE